MKQALAWAFCATAVCLTATGDRAKAAQVGTPALQEKAEEILVVGRRSGIPIWRVKSARTTLVLVGTIDGVTKNTAWDPKSLISALRMSDQVMFPQRQQVTASPFAMFGYLAKWHSQSSLPKGQSLKDFLSPAAFQRLKILQQRGVAAKDSENRHPLHLAFALRDSIEQSAGGLGQDANQYVISAVRKYRLKLVPIAKTSAKPIANLLFAGTPSRHVRCLLDAMTLAEAGSPALVARSQAWAQRRTPEVLASPAEGVFQSCFPADPDAAAVRQAALQATLNRLLSESSVTVAVVDLGVLAHRGGILDALAADGYDISGPAWK